jgi:hypothetical protein
MPFTVTVHGKLALELKAFGLGALLLMLFVLTAFVPIKKNLSAFSLNYFGSIITGSRNIESKSIA